MNESCHPGLVLFNLPDELSLCGNVLEVQIFEKSRQFLPVRKLAHTFQVPLRLVLGNFWCKSRLPVNPSKQTEVDLFEGLCSTQGSQSGFRQKCIPRGRAVKRNQALLPACPSWLISKHSLLLCFYHLISACFLGCWSAFTCTL